ncbi:MAG TPA: HEAT repeat domain-containing protein [Edaphobacter sp.]
MICLILLGSLLVVHAFGQSVDEQTEEAFKARSLEMLNALEQGKFGPATPEQVAEAREGQLVSILEGRFVHNQDADIKARVAYALMKLGDKNEAYWDFLVQQAKLAIENDAPSPRCFSSDNCVSGHPAEYVAWARAHNVTEGSQAEMALYWLEGKVSLLSGDPRGIPLLREALKSPYREIVEVGAMGLARAHDKDSIPLIVEACKRIHDPDEVRLIAHTLRFFGDDPQARAAAQAGEEQCLPPPDPIEALKRNNGDSMFYVGKAAATHPAETVAILKENFVNTQDERHKAQIASALIGLGDKGDIYWDFLLGQAISALESDASSAVKCDSQGKPIEGPSPEDKWAKDNANFQMVLLFVETVAETGDPRGVRSLQRALSSPNSDFQVFAAAGLARARDKDSVPLIIDACKNASPDVAIAIARVLVYFDDPRAQSAADQYLSKEDAKSVRAEKAEGIGPLGPWPPK